VGETRRSAMKPKVRHSDEQNEKQGRGTAVGGKRTYSRGDGLGREREALLLGVTSSCVLKITSVRLS
jgi:hypothetical protein